MDKRRAAPLLLAPFLGAEGVVYTAFLLLDLTGRGGSTVPLKYAGVLLCLLFSLLGEDRLTPLALALTACADWFLLVRNDRYLLGVGLFLCVQGVYLLRLGRNGGRFAWPLRAGLAAGAVGLTFAAGMASPLNLLAAAYFSQLLSNAALAWTRRGPRWRLFALGLTLFAGCDLCVGLYNVLPPQSPLHPAASVGMWFFYLPSQVLISLSALGIEEES